MLVLTRKQGEQIRIGNDVVITVVRTKGKAVRLGIHAPAHVPVLRGEIAKAMAADETEKAGEAVDHDDDGWPAATDLAQDGVMLPRQPHSYVQLVKLGRSPLRDLMAAHST
jgi:carbon storage regulator